MKRIYEKYKTVILYIFFGGLTTVVNILSFAVLSRVMNFGTTVPANAAAWFLSVVFAFVTNKRYVFDSDNAARKSITVQLIRFLGARVFSGVLDIVIVYVCADMLNFPEIPVKILSNIIVIVLNYAASKFFIFV